MPVRRKFYVMLEPLEVGALLNLCQREDRYPQQQAARLIREGLERANVLPERPTDVTTADNQAPEAA